MHKFVSILILLISAFAVNANAQTKFLDSLRKVEAGKGKVVVEQSPAIDRLVNGTPAPKNSTAALGASASSSSAAGNASPGSATPASSAASSSSSSASSAAAPSNSSASASSASSSPETDADASLSVDKRKKVMRNSYKTTGYRIQIYSGGNSRNDREKAQRAGDAMKAHFPTEPVYVHFYSPSWKCRMGNYRELAEAQRILAQVKALGYKEACIVKGTISVQY